jgi:serine/threonine-protein kinase SRPK3
MSLSLSSDDICNIDNTEFSGKLLKKRYTVLKIIGYGACAGVWLAYDTVNNKLVVIKIHTHDSYDEGIAEINIYKLLKNKKCVMNMLDNFEYDDDEYMRVCIVFPLYGVDLSYIIKNINKQTYIHYDTINGIIGQIKYAMRCLHEIGRYHGDIKPDNILTNIFASETSKIIEFVHNMNVPNMITKAKKTNKITTSDIGDMIYKKFKTFEASGVNKKKNMHKSNQTNSDSQSSNESDGTDSECTIWSYHNSPDNDSDDDIVNDNGDSEIITKFINDSSIVLMDFGLCNKNEPSNSTIQTRYYRAPEVILKMRHDSTCDIWSIGCIIYELLTGKLLFNPTKTDEISTDKMHLKKIIEYFGFMSDHFDMPINNTIYFRSDGTLKSVRKLKRKCLLDNMRKNVLEEFSDNSLNEICETVLKYLSVNPCNRQQ